MVNGSIACLNVTETFGLFDPSGGGLLNTSKTDEAALYVVAMSVKCAPEEVDPCSAEKLAEYDIGLHVGAVFIILGASTIGTGLPLLMKRKPKCFPYPFVFTIGKHIGTGVLVSLALIHLLVPAFEALGSSCLVKDFQSYPFSPLFALIAALLMHLIESIAFLISRKAPRKKITASMPSPDMNILKRKDTTPSEMPTPAQSPSGTPRKQEFDVEEAADFDPEDHHGHSHGHFIGSGNKTVSAFILEFGLTTHSVIIGITVGVASNDELPSLIAALTFHQFFEGVALGARLAEVGLSGVRYDT